MMARRQDLPDVVMRFDGLRRSHECFDPLPQTRTPRGMADTASPYRSGLGQLRELQGGGASTPRTPTSGNKMRRLMRPSTASSSSRDSKRLSLRRPDGKNLESKAKAPSFQSNVVGMVSDLRNQTIKDLGKDTSLINQEEMAQQQTQVMHTCEMLGDIAKLVAQAEQGRNTRVVGDTLKEALVSQQRVANTLKEQIAAQQMFSQRLLKKNKEIEVALETERRRLRNEVKKSYDLEVENKALRIKVLDARFHASRGTGESGKQEDAGGPIVRETQEGLHHEGSYRKSLHDHHEKLQALQSMVDHLDTAVTGGHSHDKLKEVSRKLRKEIVDVYEHYMQGPHHPSHWRNPGDHHKMHHYEMHTIASSHTTTAGLEMHQFDGGYDPALHHEHGLLSSSARGQYDQSLGHNHHTNDHDAGKPIAGTQKGLHDAGSGAAGTRRALDSARGAQSEDALKDRVVSLSSMAFWTWDFAQLQETVCAATGADAARFIVHNYVTGGFVSSGDATVDGGIGSIGSLFRIMPKDAPISLAAVTAEARSPILISDLSADHRRHPSLDLQPWDDALTCMISMPIRHKMKVGGEEQEVVVGVLQVAAKGVSGFDERAKKAVRTVADVCAEPLAVRLSNEVKIFDVAAHGATVAKGIAAAVAGSYDAALIAPLLEQYIQQTIVCDAATVLWVDHADPPVLHRVDGSKIASQSLQGVTERCISTGETLNISRLQEYPGFVEECDVLPELQENAKSLLVIPFFGANQEVAGVLRLESLKVDAFNSFESHSINTVRAIASLALGSVLQNSTVTFSRRDRNAVVLREDTDTPPLYRACHALDAQLRAAASGQMADVIFYGVDQVQYQVEMIHYKDERASSRKATEIGVGLCGDTAATGLVSRVANTCQDSRFNLDVDLSAPEFSNRASLWIPIRNLDGQITGVAALFTQGNAEFEDGTCAMLVRLCHEYGTYFSDLVYLDALDAERRRWKSVSQSILQVFDSAEMLTTIGKVKDAFTQVFNLGRCQQWTFDARTASLTYSPGRGAGKDVTVSVNGTEHLCKCARSGKMHIVPAASLEDNPEEERIDLRALPNSAQMALMVVPLMDSSHKPILVIQAERAYSFSQLEQEMMIEMTKIGALALEHVRILETESVPGAKHFEQALTSALTVEDAMRELMAACRKMCQCTNAVVFWPSPDGSMCKYYHEMGQIKMKTFVATGGNVGIAAECLAERKPMLLHDARIHIKFHEGMDGLQDIAASEPADAHGPRQDAIQAIYFPVILKDTNEPIAVMCVREKKRGMALNRQDMIALGVLARQAALTLKNVERHEGLLEIARTRDLRHNQMANLNSIRTMQMEALSQIASHCPLNEIVKKMGDVMCEILNVEICQLHLVEGGGKILRTFGDDRFQDKLTDVMKAMESDIACRVLRENETILFDLSTLLDNNTGQGLGDATLKFEVKGIEMLSSLTVPLRGDLGQVFAVLQLINKRGEESFSGSDELVVHMAGNAYKTVLDANVLSEVRFEIGLGSVKSSIEDISMSALERAMLLVGADAGQVLVLVEDHSVLKRCAEVTSAGERIGAGARGFATGLKNSSSHLYDATQGIAGHVINTARTMNISELRQEPRFETGIDLKLNYEGIHSLLCCPMLTSTGQCMGVLQLVKEGVGQFTDRMAQLLDILARQAGIMVFNREQFELSMSSSLEQVLRVTESVMWCLEVQPNVDLLVNRMTESAITIVPCENAVLMFKTKSNQDDIWTKIVNKTEEVWPYKKRDSRTAFSGKKPHRDAKIPAHNGIIAEALQSRNPVFVHRPDPRLTLDFEALCVSEVNNMLVIPIFRDARDSVAGILVLLNKRENFVLEDSRKLEHYRSAIFPTVECIGRCQGWELANFLGTMTFGYT